ncbi:TonB-dependent receptor [Niveispirillum fermenti]|uniref:TonB-dependent receptor n=1 Tax=Niveispirillum fermenti TaxID=1233113 RepID=UPI003A8A5B99
MTSTALLARCRPHPLPLLAGLALTALPLLPSMAQSTGSQEILLEEIIVTAQKRLENLQTVPASVSVLSGAQMAKSSPGGLADYAAYLPGFSVTSAGTPGQVTIALRGISAVGQAATVGTYIDDTPLGSSSNYARATSFALDLFPYDIQQVEVLRGPQGTLYGASTMGGLLKYVTRQPDLNKTEVRFGAEMSGTDKAGGANWGVRGQVNIPLVEDRLAIQASAFRQENAGYIDNPMTGARNTNPVDQEGARIAALWRPAETVTVRLSALFQKVDALNNSVAAYDPVTDRPLGGRLDSRYRMDQSFDKDLSFYSGTLDWDLDWANLTSATSYSKAETVQGQDASLVYGDLFPMFTGGAVAPGLAPFELGLDLEKWTQEVRLTSPSGQGFEWMLGGFYTWEDSVQAQLLNATDINGNPVPGLDPMAIVSIPSRYEEVAVFGNATVALTDRFDVTAGLRWARNEQDYQQITDGALVGGAAEMVGASSENVLTFMVSPRLRVNDDLTLYTRVASSYRPGGPNVALPGLPPSVDADTLISYEGGVKSTLLDGRLLANAAVFLIDWKDIQIAASNGGIGYLENGGKARSAGLEFETVLLPGDGWRLGFNGAYTDAFFKGDVPSVGALDNDRLPLIPKFSFSVTADQEIALAGDWTGNFGGGYRWSGSTYNAAPNAPEAVSTKSYGVLDLHAGVSDGTVSVRAFVRNAMNSRATTSASMLTSAVGVQQQIDRTVLQPRTIGLSLDVTY